MRYLFLLLISIKFNAKINGTKERAREYFLFFLFDIKKERDFNMGSWKHSGSLNIEMSNREIENAKFARKYSENYR